MNSFIGDQNLSTFFQNLCANGDISTGIILVHQLLTSNNSTILNVGKKDSNIGPLLQFANCSHIYYSQISTTELKNTLQISTSKRHQHLQLLFEVDPISSSFIFQNLMFSLSEIYQICLTCLPFILLFDGQLSSIVQWSTLIFSKVNHFRATIIPSVSGQSRELLHIRPIFDGCLTYQGVFVPKTKNDFCRLKVPFEKCNLSGKLLNVSISTVKFLS